MHPIWPFHYVVFILLKQGLHMVTHSLCTHPIWLFYCTIFILLKRGLDIVTHSLYMHPIWLFHCSVFIQTETSLSRCIWLVRLRKKDVTGEHCTVLGNRLHVKFNYYWQTMCCNAFRMKHHLAGTRQEFHNYEFTNDFWLMMAYGIIEV